MKYVLLIGASDAGKSTTIEEVCKQLKPEKYWYFDEVEEEYYEAKELKIFDGTHLIQVEGKIILVVAGCPTEQNWRITDIVADAKFRGFEIAFLIVAKRLFERKEGFSTEKELEKIGEDVHIERIYRINGDNFRETPAWKERVENIVLKIKSNL